MLVVLSRSSLHGELRGPSSKSVAQRLILSTLFCSPGVCTLRQVVYSDDVNASLNFVKNLGVNVETERNKLVLEIPDELTVRERVINLGDSGTTYRIALGIAATLSQEVVLECGRTMRRRPIGDLVEALKKLGAKITYLEEIGYPPVLVRGPIRGGKVEISGKVSSQFISALIYAGIGSKDGVEVRVRPPVVSKPYIELTARVIEALGGEVEIENLDEEGLIVYAYPSELKKFDLEVPADFALSAYIMAITGLAGDEVVIRGFDTYLNPVDREIVNIFKEMDLDIKHLGDVVYITQSDQPSAIEISLKDNPDLVMPVAAVAVYARGETVIRDVWHLAYKESNRLAEVKRCIEKFGGNIEVDEEQGVIKIRGVTKTIPAEITLPDDHRIAMMCSVLGLNTDDESKLKNAECVKKSWPTYWDDLKKLGANIEIR